MSEDTSIQTGYVFGRRIDSGRPRGQLGTVVDTSPASEDRVRRAREFFEEIPADELERLNARLWRHRESGIGFRICEAQVLEARMPTLTGVTAFTLVGDHLVFLKIRGHQHFTEQVHHGTVHAVKIDATPGTLTNERSGEAQALVDDLPARVLE